MSGFVFFAVGQRAWIAVATLLLMAFLFGVSTRMHDNCPRIIYQHLPVTTAPPPPPAAEPVLGPR